MGFMFEYSGLISLIIWIFGFQLVFYGDNYWLIFYKNNAKNNNEV